VDNDAIWFNTTADQNDPFEWNWSAPHTDNYTFFISLWDETYGKLLNIQYHTIYLSAVYEAVWFEYKGWVIEDLENDGFSETVIFKFDIDTWGNYNQRGWLSITIFDPNGTDVDNDTIWFNITSDQKDPFEWNWSAPQTSNYTFNLSLWNETYDKLFHIQKHTIHLSVVYEAAWFDFKGWVIKDFEDDGFFETVIFGFDIDTWGNFNQRGWLSITIFDSEGTQIDEDNISFNITADQKDPFEWNWSAPQTSNYTFVLSLWNENSQTQFHMFIQSVYLEKNQEPRKEENNIWKIAGGVILIGAIIVASVIFIRQR